MKKTVSLILLLETIIMLLAGCAYNGYEGEHSDLYTVVINSVLWNNGHSFSADKYIDPQIEIIDTDMYGRTLFTYHEEYYAGADISFTALVICQSSNENEVFYYEDINYIVKEQELYAQNLKQFEDDEIEQLKLANDWNREVNFNKCVEKEIIKSKPAVPYEQEIANNIIDEYHLVSGEYSLFLDYLTGDTTDSNFIVYGYIYKNGEEDIYFIGLVKTQQESIKEVQFFVPSNVFDYQTEFIGFKKSNNWEG